LVGAVGLGGLLVVAYSSTRLPSSPGPSTKVVGTRIVQIFVSLTRKTGIFTSYVCFIYVGVTDLLRLVSFVAAGGLRNRSGKRNTFILIHVYFRI